MANTSIDEWAGKAIAVRFVPEGIGENQQTQAGCTLESADERGVLVSFHMEDESNRLIQRLRFIPWHKIESIDLVTK